MAPHTHIRVHSHIVYLKHSYSVYTNGTHTDSLFAFEMCSLRDTTNRTVYLA